ncbi:MAG: hypothetical protein AAGA96_14830 [Verrucomicrobiota bacterium]
MADLDELKIERVFVACHKGDFHLARICVASIRYYYPSFRITLVKDRQQGDFSTTETERSWNVDVLELKDARFGLGFSKLEVLFLEEISRILVVDADTIFVGGVIEHLESVDADVVVHQEYYPPGHAQLERNYFDLARLAKIDPSYTYPGFVFNTGAIAMRPGLLHRDDFETVVDFQSTPRLRNPEVFKCADQGVLNYVISKKASAGEVEVGACEFMLWSGVTDQMEAIDLRRIKQKTDTSPILVHWAGRKPFFVSKMPRSDLLSFFEAYYYGGVFAGRLKRLLRSLFRRLSFYASKMGQK